MSAGRRNAAAASIDTASLRGHRGLRAAHCCRVLSPTSTHRLQNISASSAVTPCQSGCAGYLSALRANHHIGRRAFARRALSASCRTKASVARSPPRRAGIEGRARRRTMPRICLEEGGRRSIWTVAAALPVALREENTCASMPRTRRADSAGTPLCASAKHITWHLVTICWRRSQHGTIDLQYQENAALVSSV